MIQFKLKKFRVITVEESDGINYAITALSYVNENMHLLKMVQVYQQEQYLY